MNAIVRKIALSALLILCVASIGALGQGRCSDRANEITENTKIIKDKKILTQDPARVIAAVDRLGELKATSAVDELANLLTLDRGEKYFDRENPPSGGIITPYSIYPAVKALANIGEKSVPALIRIIRSEEVSSLATRNATEALRAIFRDDPSRGYEILLEAATTSETESEMAKLLKVAEIFRNR